MYGKLFSSMYDGSLYGNWKAMVTFQQMIILCGPDGVIDMTPMALAARTGIPLEIIQEGIKVLEEPDPYSRTRDNDGKRIDRIDSHRPWGWLIINHAKYRRMVDAEEKREADRVRIAAKRAAEKAAKEPDKRHVAENATVAQVSQVVADVAHTEAEAVKEKEEAASAAVVDPWRYGVELLAGVGMSAVQARSFVGKLCRDWDEGVVHDALMAATGKVDPRSYARKWLEAKPKKCEKPPGVVYRHGQATIGGFVA